MKPSAVVRMENNVESWPEEGTNQYYCSNEEKINLSNTLLWKHLLQPGS
jgi:hypothetical protein